MSEEKKRKYSLTTLSLIKIIVVMFVLGFVVGVGFKIMSIQNHTETQCRLYFMEKCYEPTIECQFYAEDSHELLLNGSFKDVFDEYGDKMKEVGRAEQYKHYNCINDDECDIEGMEFDEGTSLEILNDDIFLVVDIDKDGEDEYVRREDVENIEYNTTENLWKVEHAHEIY